MLKFIECFDHLSATSLADASLYTALGYHSLYGGWDGTFRIVPGAGQRGTSALEIASTGIIGLPYIDRNCKKLILGICIGSPILGQVLYQGSLRNRQRWAKTSSLDISGFVADFRYDDLINFSVTCVFDTDETVKVSMKTGTTGYPPIITNDFIPVPRLYEVYTFIELYVDVTDYKNGRAKVAVNGVTYIDKQGIVTADYEAFDDDPYDDRANLNNIKLTLNFNNTWEAGNGGPYSGYYIDTIYLCDDAGGYHDDFLGPIFAQSLYPVADGNKHNWTPYENSTVLPDGQNGACIDDDPLLPGDEVTYVEADQDLIDDLLVFDADDYPNECTLVAVNHRTAFRNVASEGNPPPPTIVPLYQIIGNPVVVTNSEAQKAIGWDYAFLDVYYNTVPSFAIPWTRLLLDQSQFGYLVRESAWEGVALETMDFADEAVVEGD